MKKYFIIAVVALVASAACTKVEIDQTVVPAHKINFEVASYMAQTKAVGTGTSLWGEGFTGTPSFYTSAFYYPASGTGNQTYMNKVQITPYKSDDTTAADAEGNTAVWRPANDYFWPKTGYINFFSFASVRDIASQVSFADATGETKTVSFGTAAAPIVVASTDNIMLADACYNAKESNAGEDQDTVTGPSETTPMGVPTLFRHLLCQVKFEAQLKSSKKHATTVYDVEITSASVSGTTGTGIHSNGFLEVTSAAKLGDALQIKPWGTSGTVAWSDATTPAYDTFTLTGTSSDLRLPVSATATDHTSASKHTLLEFRSFRPQTIGTDVNFNITYVVKASNDGGSTYYSQETLTASVALKGATPNSGDWRCNDKITYLINIDPVSSRITFDPAVVAWDATPSGTINIQ